MCRHAPWMMCTEEVGRHDCGPGPPPYSSLVFPTTRQRTTFPCLCAGELMNISDTYAHPLFNSKVGLGGVCSSVRWLGLWEFVEFVEGRLCAAEGGKGMGL